MADEHIPNDPYRSNPADDPYRTSSDPYRTTGGRGASQRGSPRQ